MPLTLHITFTIPSHSLPTFYTALRTIQEHLVKEDECLYMNVYEIAGQPGVVRLVEVWDCEVEYMMGVQAKKEYYAPFFEVADRVVSEPRKLEVLNGVDGFRFMRS